MAVQWCDAKFRQTRCLTDGLHELSKKNSIVQHGHSLLYQFFLHKFWLKASCWTLGTTCWSLGSCWTYAPQLVAPWPCLHSCRLLVWIWAYQFTQEVDRHNTDLSLLLHDFIVCKATEARTNSSGQHVMQGILLSTVVGSLCSTNRHVNAWYQSIHCTVCRVEASASMPLSQCHIQHSCH